MSNRRRVLLCDCNKNNAFFSMLLFVVVKCGMWLGKPANRCLCRSIQIYSAISLSMEIKWSALYLFYCKQIRIDGFDSLCFYIRQKKKTATYKNIAYNTAAGNQHRIYCKKIVAMARNQSKSIQICCLLLLHAEKNCSFCINRTMNNEWYTSAKNKNRKYAGAG